MALTCKLFSLINNKFKGWWQDVQLHSCSNVADPGLISISRANSSVSSPSLLGKFFN